MTIRGQVVDDKNGEPIKGATICFQSAFGNVSVKSVYRTETSDAGGRFEFRGVRVKEALTSYVCMEVMKPSYDWTKVVLGSSSNFKDPIQVRLEPDREVRLPQGVLRIRNEQFANADEPTFRFLFKNGRLAFANEDEPTDFQLQFKFQPKNDRKDRMLGCLHLSKSGRSQFLESVTTAGGIGLFAYERTFGHPPRLPDLSTVTLADSFSFDQPYDSQFRRKNEFLLKTHDDKSALLHFNGDSRIEWVYQPNGSTDIDRRRKKRSGTGHCWKCDYVSD